MARNVEFNEEEAIQKAMEVFWAKGYNSTTLRDLTKAMKINSSSLYNTIGDKHDLFIRCVQHYSDQKRNDYQKWMATSESRFTILVNYIHDAVNVIINGENSCMAVRTAFELATDDQRVKSLLKADSDYGYRFMQTLIKGAMEEGKIAKDEDPEVLGEYFVSIYTGWNQSYILHKDADRIRKMADYFIKQISK
jgi:TetR/AcrR family transcriptional repressor of nem operon